MADQQEGNIRQHINTANVGLNMDSSIAQIKSGQYSYALNSSVENFDGNALSIQNEPGNEFCVKFPEGYVLIGSHFINEQTKFIYFITDPSTGGSQIGYMSNNDCEYRVLINAPCLNFNVHHPIHPNNVVHKITNCSTEIYWTDGYNPRRYLDIDNIPKIIRFGSPLCNPMYTDDVDCNQLKVQPDFSIPQLDVVEITNTGAVISGTYQFAAQYSDASGNPYTSYYSVTNPTPIADTQIATVNFNSPVGKSIVIAVSNLDITGYFNYFNVAVIKTVNAISSVELIGTYFIDDSGKQIIYTGQTVDNIRLSINDIFEKFPYYDIAKGLTTAQDILIWDQLTTIDRLNYQQIANKIKLEWETWRIPATENYADELNATNFRSYLRDEVYAFEFVPLSASGRQYDGFHIPGRIKNYNESLRADVLSSNNDYIGNGDPQPYWAIYNTASVEGTHPEYSTHPSYKGAYQYGEFAYWESTDEYPCNSNVWGELAGQKIRHHKFPDVLVSPIFETKLFTNQNNMVMGNDAIFPIGVRVNIQQVQSLIMSSNLTDVQKADIVGFKIVRGDRGTNKSIIAKGILRNVGSYTKGEKEYYFPNYPYNDLREDPFINLTNNAYDAICDSFDVTITELVADDVTGAMYAELEYTACDTNKSNRIIYYSVSTAPFRICSIEKPVMIAGKGTIAYVNYDRYYVASKGNTIHGYTVHYNDRITGPDSQFLQGTGGGSRDAYIEVVRGTEPTCQVNCDHAYFVFLNTVIEAEDCFVPESLSPVKSSNSNIQIFNSPETSFGQPFLGNVLKLESVIFGAGKAHFTEVKDNAKYRLVSKEAQIEALDSSAAIAGITKLFDVEAMFAAYQAYLTIYINGITRKNYAYSYNSIADYNYMNVVPNDIGVKQRNIDLAKYLIPAVVSIEDDNDINNWQRESSVFIKLSGEPLPFPDNSPTMLSGDTPIVKEQSRFTISQKGNCNSPGKQEDIQVVSYYASMKNVFPNQWGQIYSYDTIDTGFQQIFNTSSNHATIFGGDTFISRFAFKTKLPFFIDNRVNAPDDSDIFYDEIGNVGYPKYWHSSRSILEDYDVPHGDSDDAPGTLTNIISYKAHNFDCPNDTSLTTGITTTILGTTTTTTTALWDLTHGKASSDGLVTSTRSYYDGYYYLFAYGVPNFYCESSYNLDLRQAFNNREGDFWPHITNSIPDDWVQESFVSIANDNTYNYNVTFSKQNKENFFSHLPFDWEDKFCYTTFPFRAIYSDVQNTDSNNKVNSWLTYRALSYFDFPQNFGALTSLDGIENRAILARFENKTLMYDKLLTIDTSNPQSAYVGNPKLFSNLPIDFAETDLGYVGSQNKMLLKIPQGQITVDAKRGQVFLLSGQQATDLSGFGSGMNRFFTDHTAFEILRYFPEANIDNNYNGTGLHGVYDSKYDRVILTKLDYVPIDDRIKYDSEKDEYYIEEISTITTYECDLWGEAVESDICIIDGIAIENESTTTTTTVEPPT